MGNPFVVEIKDFQSLQNVKISLDSGVNIITGKTNQGKSAVIRAIDSSLFNIGDDDMVRGGKRYSAISLDNGRHRLVFCRDNKGKSEKTAYQFDGGDVQKKVGRGQLPEVSRMFNIRDVRMQNNTKMKLNFWYQNDKPFLMDKTAGQLYEFLSLSSCDSYTKILKKMVVDLKVLQADINNITTEMDTIKIISNRKKEFVERNSGYESLYLRIITASQEDARVKSIREVIDRIIDCKKKMDVSSVKLSGINRVLDSIPVDDLTDKVSLLMDSVISNEKVFRGISRLQGLDSSVKEKEVEFSDLCGVLKDSDNIVGEIMKKISLLGSDERKLGDIYKSLDMVRVKGKDMLVAEEKLNKLDKSTYSNVDTDVLMTRINMLDRERLEMIDLGKRIAYVSGISSKIEVVFSSGEELETELGNLEGELDTLKSSAGYCPFCSTVFHNGSCS